MKGVGAVAIDRSGSHNVVQQMVAEFARQGELVLVSPPEGTRRRVDY